MNLLLRIAYVLFGWKRRLLRSVTMGVRLLLVENGQVILVRHTYQSGWQFPGGSLKFGETVAQGAAREAFEEVGVRLLAEPKLLGIYTNFGEGHSDHVITFFAHEFVQEQATDRWEIAEARAFPLHELPAGLTAGYRRRIQDYLAGNAPYTGVW
jgi:ADP-ribose pyrophosphatase YjhB (NUDIX family)